MNPARAFGPDLVLGEFGTLWVYIVGPMLGAAAAVLLDTLLSGRATLREAATEQSVTLDAETSSPDARGG